MPRRHRTAARIVVLMAAAAAAAGLILTPAAIAATSTTTTLAAPARPEAGLAVTLRATVNPTPSGGTVAFTSGTQTIYGCDAVRLTSGTALCTTTFAGTGRVTLRARYSGTSGFAASSAGRSMTVIARQPQLVGGVGACTTSSGALVGVDFGRWHPPVARGCSLHPTSGLDLLADAGFSTTGDQRDGPAFVCRIGYPGVANGRQYPTPAQDPCIVTPPAAAYWVYWIAAAGTNTWTFSTLGAASYQPKRGEVDAWVYGGTPVGAGGPAPSFTPNQVRAGLPGPTANGATNATSTAGSAPALAGVPDVPAATRFVAATRTPAGDPGATSLAADGYAQTVAGFADFGLTIDGAFALAATGGDDEALRAIATFIDERHRDAGGRTVDDWTGYGTSYANGGSLAKQALLAEVTGFDPRTFGGHDLIGALDETVCHGADAARGCAATGNYAYATSVFAQSLGVLAQLRGGDDSNATGPAVDYLLAQQHTDGSWPSLLPASADSDVDSTAVAAMALTLLPHDARANAAVGTAVTWLAGQQHTDGGFAGATGESTNSTGLALLGLRLVAGHGPQIARALAFLGARQNADGGFAIGLSGASDLRASTQALSGSVGTSFATLTRDVSGLPPSAHADAAAAAHWLTGQLVDGSHLEYAGGFGPNYGGTADIAFALAAVTTQNATLRTVVAYLAHHVADYADPDGSGQYPGPYSGATAKLALLAEVMQQSPTAFGGYDLIHTLTSHVCTAPDDSGACTAAGDFYQAFSTVSQALGVLALVRARVPVPAAALARLLQLQCIDGGFSSTLIRPGADCTSDPDTTGYAVQALQLVPGAAIVVGDAVQYLHRDQQNDGGYQGTAGINTNTTSLATLALIAHGAGLTDSPVAAAESWLAGRQNVDGGLGISADSPASDALATAQAVPAIVGTPLSTLLHQASNPGGPSGSPTPSGPTGSGSPTSLASTGADSRAGLSSGLALLLGGILLCLLGRRRRRPRYAAR